MNSSFTFDRFNLDPESGVVRFNYTLIKDTKTYQFEEKITLPEPIKQSETDIVLNKILQSVHIALGMSYWKLYCPQDIKFSAYQLTKKQANFWNTIYTKGLGEFYYKNFIDFHYLIHFPYDDLAHDESVKCSLKNRSLVGIGGGKDSIVTARLLQNAGADFDGFIVETQRKYLLTHGVAKVLKINEVNIRREISPRLFELNKQPDTYNGHIPISVIYAFLGILCAYLYDYKNVIVSNERSSDYGNIEYLGEMVNHQWSKSSEFEQLFQNYITDTITQDIHYFSLLRPLSELQIAELFAKEKQFHHIFSSCNRNFTITQASSKSWCGECPKCAFTFILMAVFSTKDEVLKIFGENYLDKQKLLPLYKQLLGIEGHKPFECVGTPKEATVAMAMIHDKAEFENSVIMKEFVTHILPDSDIIKKLNQDVFSSKSDHLIPSEFQSIIPTLSS